CSRRSSGIEIMARAPITSAERRQEGGHGLHLLLAQLQRRHVGVRTLGGWISEPALEVDAGGFRPHPREGGGDRRPHLPDRVTAVTSVVHEVLLALVGELLGARRCRQHSGDDEREHQRRTHHRLASDIACRTVSTGHVARRITRSATEPSRTRFRPLRPWVPITIMSTRSSSAILTISLTGTPTCSRQLALIPRWRRSPIRDSRAFSAHLRWAS